MSSQHYEAPHYAALLIPVLPLLRCQAPAFSHNEKPSFKSDPNTLREMPLRVFILRFLDRQVYFALATHITQLNSSTLFAVPNE